MLYRLSEKQMDEAFGEAWEQLVGLMDMYKLLHSDTNKHLEVMLCDLREHLEDLGRQGPHLQVVPGNGGA